jgi:hypothetical protein
MTKLFSLKATYSVGEKHTYGIATGIYGYTLDNKAVGINFNMTMTVVQVANSNATIKITTSRPKSGDTTLPFAYKDSTVVLDSSNRPVKKSSSGQIFAILPQHPVKIGDTWEGSTTLNLGSNRGALVATTYKLSSIRVDKGKHIAQVHMTMSGLASGEGTELIDLADGSLLTSDMNLRLNESKKIPIQIILKRLA